MTSRHHTIYPVLDAPRDGDPLTYPGRAILDVHGFIEPYLDETDYWVAMPVRLFHSIAADFGIELGPYSLGKADIEVLRAAIASYDLATGPNLKAVE